MQRRLLSIYAGLPIAALAFAMLLSPSNAADNQIPPTTLGATSWAGFYAGVRAGAVDSSTTIRDEDGTIFDADGGTLTTNDLTGLLGVHAGYNWQIGTAVFGVEADYSWTNAGRTREFDGTDHRASSQLDGFGSIRGRAGVAVDNALIYLTGGIGYVDADVSGEDSFPTQFVRQDGFLAAVAGFGAEIKLRSDVSFGLEYLHYMLSDETTFCGDCDEGPQIFGGSLNVLSARLTYHFGETPDPVELSGNDVWSGFYAGVHAGAIDASTAMQDEDDDVLDTEGIAIFTNSLDASGGIHGGYNWMVGSALIGVEADYSWTNSGYSRVYNNGNHYLSSQINGIASVRARLGLAAGNALAYVTGGAALINANIDASDIGSAGENVSFDQFTALVLGAGAEIKISSNLSLRGEYLYYGFDEQSTVCASCIQPQFVDGTIHSFRAGLSYYLNGNGTQVSDTYVADWSGLYAGLHAGFVDSTTGIRDENRTLFDDEGTTSFTTSQDIGGGIYAGYNVQMQNAVIGLEVDYTFTDSGQTRFFDDADHFKSSQINGFGSVRGKIGLAAGDALFYATGGIGFVDATMQGYDSIPNQVVNYDGFAALVAGVGTEFKLSKNLSVRAEYLYYGFDEQSDLCNDCGVDPAFADGQLHTFRAGLTWQFN